jgi:hypothetical protein
MNGNNLGSVKSENNVHDAALIATNSQAKVWVNDDYLFDVRSAQYSWDGKYVCQSGYTSYPNRCQIQVTNAYMQWDFQDGKGVRRGVEGRQCAGGNAVAHGDSGGPVWSIRPDGDVAARGIVSGGHTLVAPIVSYEYILVTEVLTATAALGVSLQTSRSVTGTPEGWEMRVAIRIAVIVGALGNLLAALVLPWARYGSIDIPLHRFPGWFPHVAAVIVLYGAALWALLWPPTRQPLPLAVSGAAGLVAAGSAATIAIRYDDASSLFDRIVPAVVPTLGSGGPVAILSVIVTLAALAVLAARTRGTPTRTNGRPGVPAPSHDS